jgi:outer membrane lipase/esterase
MIRTLMAASALFGSMALAGAAMAATPSPFVGETAFGDSLSDGGDLSILEGSSTIMRFTTNPGLTTVENVAAFYGLTLTPSLAGGTNYAYGGAGVVTDAPGAAGIPTLTTQITGYLASNPTLNPNELYTVFGGANDIFYHATSAAAAQVAATLTAGQSAAATAAIDALVEKAEGITTLETAAQASTAVAGAATQELSLISSLQKAGAHYIVVFNLPNIGATPEAKVDEAQVAGSAAALTGYSQLFNSTLNAGLAGMKVGIIPVNTYALLGEVLANPTAYGFVNTTIPACTSSSSFTCTSQTLVNPTAATNYVFADGVHPTTATHALFAQVIESEIIAPQQASLLAEQPLATLDAHRSAIGEQLLQDQTSDARGLRVFATGGYVHQHTGGQAYTAAARDDDGLITGGVDYRLNAALNFGVAISGATATEDLSGQLRRFKTDAQIASVFGQYVAGQAYVTAVAGYGALQFHGIQRAFKLGPDTRGESADAAGQTALASLTGGYWFDAKPVQVGPFVGATYERVRVDGYHETSGDSTAMTFAAQTREALLTQIGLRARASVTFNGVGLRPFAEIAYTYDADARQRDVVAGLTTMNGNFAIPGFTPDRDWAQAQIGVEAAFTPRLSAYAAYQGRFAGAASGYDGVNFGVRYGF